MKYMNLSIEEIHEKLKNGEVTSKELIEESLKLSHDVQDPCTAANLQPERRPNGIPNQ